MVNATTITDWLELSDCNVTHWLMVLLGCVAAMSEGMGLSGKTRHNGLIHLFYNVLTSKCCCPEPPSASPAGATQNAPSDDEVTANTELTSKSVTKRVTRSTATT